MPPSRPKGRFAVGLETRLRAQPAPRDFRPRESHQSAPGAAPISAGSPRTPGLPSRPQLVASLAGTTGMVHFRKGRDADPYKAEGGGRLP